MAQMAARIWAERGDNLLLVGRKLQSLEVIKNDLKVRRLDGAKSKLVLMESDLSDDTSHEELLGEILKTFPKIDLVLLAYGVLGNQRDAETDAATLKGVLQTNFVSAAMLLERFAEIFEKQGWGQIAAISSVAGMRGRQSNYLYGASKAGLTAYLSGLRNRLSGKGVHVLTIHPGFIDTPMTRDFKKGKLWISSDRAGLEIVRAIDAKKDVVFVPWFWRLIMLVICHIPERVFKKLKL